jgi:hypothetical protein
MVFVYTVCIDSRHRDALLYPNPADYVIDLDEVLKNVSSVELVSAIYTKVLSDTESFVVLHIRDIQSHTISNSMSIRESFTTLPLVQEGVNVYHKSMFQSLATFEPPLLKLGKLSVRFLKSNGEAYPMTDHMLRFQIQTLSHSQILEWNPPPTKSKDCLRVLGLDTTSEYTEDQLTTAFKRKYKDWKRRGGSGGKTDVYYIELKKALKESLGVFQQAD